MSSTNNAFIQWYRKNSVKIHVDSVLATIFSALLAIFLSYLFSSSEVEFLVLSNAFLHIFYVPIHLSILYLGDTKRFSGNDGAFSAKKLGVEYAGVYGTQVSLFFLYNAIAVPAQAYLAMMLHWYLWLAFLLAHLLATFATRPAHGVLYFLLHRVLQKISGRSR